MKNKIFTDRKYQKVVQKSYNILGRNDFNLYDFFKLCPFTIEQLRIDNRHLKIKEWRHLGIFWSLLSGNNLLETGEIFKRTHSIAYHSLNIIYNDLHWYGENSIYIDRIKAILIKARFYEICFKLNDFDFCLMQCDGRSKIDHETKFIQIDYSLLTHENQFELYDFFVKCKLENAKELTLKVIDYYNNLYIEKNTIS